MFDVTLWTEYPGAPMLKAVGIPGLMLLEPADRMTMAEPPVHRPNASTDTPDGTEGNETVIPGVPAAKL